MSDYLPDCHPWLSLDRAAGSWLYATDESRYLDFGDGGRIALLGHGYPSISWALTEALGTCDYPGSPMDVAGPFVSRYAEALSSRLTPAGQEPWQVLPCSSVSEAQLVLGQITRGEHFLLRVISSGHHLDGGMVQDLVHRSRAGQKLVVADETVTGFGRTGQFLGIDHYGLVPDVVMLGPAGGGGLPFAALAAPATVFSRIKDVGPVFVSPLACAAAYGVLSGLTEEVLAHVTVMGTVLAQAMITVTEQFGNPERITGTGLLRQVHLTRPEDAERFRQCCRHRGLLIGADLSLTPPLTVTEDEILAAADVMAEVLMEWE